MRAAWTTLPVLVDARNRTQHGTSLYALQRSRRYAPVIPGVRAHPTKVRRMPVPQWAGDAWVEHLLRVEALQMQLPDSVLSHASAMRHYGLPVPNRLDDSRIDLVSPQRTFVRGAVRRHAPTDDESGWFYGATIMPYEVVLRQACGLLRERELVTVIGALCGTWHGPPVLTLERIHELAMRWRGVRGVRSLRNALRRSRADVGSPQETDLRLAIVEAGFPEPLVHVPVDVRGFRVHPDLAYPDLRIAIEYEGDHHRASSRQWEADIVRERRMREAGWVYLRVTRATDRATFFADLSQAMRSQAAKLS